MKFVFENWCFRKIEDCWMALLLSLDSHGAGFAKILTSTSRTETPPAMFAVLLGVWGCGCRRWRDRRKVRGRGKSLAIFPQNFLCWIGVRKRELG